jgi:hypothetical protein
VRDTTGGVLPGVNVEVQNLETNLTQTRVTDDTGRFFLQLLPGRFYRVTFRLAGFTTIVQDEVVLTVGQAINLNPRMTVSAVQETATVSGMSSVETARAAVATTLNQAAVEKRPSWAGNSRTSSR